MSHLPLFLDVNDVAVLVVGGGIAAERKVRALVANGARVTVRSPVLDEALAVRVRCGELRHDARAFAPSMDAADYRLVIAALGDPARNGEIARWAQDHRLWVNAVDDPRHCSAMWPAVVDRGPLKVAIGSGGAAPVLARRIRARIEQLLPQRIGDLVSLAGRYRDRVARRFATFEGRRRFWERAFESWEYAGAEARFEQLLDCSDNASAHVHLVGAGPGAADLLTLRAVHIMQTADVIVHDRLVPPEVLARARRDAEFISVGKVPGEPCISQAEINAILLEHAQAGRTVCRLKGGDPMVFGRAGEEIQALEDAGITVSVVPGITAALACAASMTTSLTHRDHSHALVLATAHGKDARAHEELASLAGLGRTLAVYMGVRQLEALVATLRRRGLPGDLPIRLVENGARPEERAFPSTLASVLADARAVGLKSPALILIGRAMAVRDLPRRNRAVASASA